MQTTRSCKECGGPLPADAPEGLCPRCLLQKGIESTQGDSGSAGSLPAGPAKTIQVSLPPDEQTGDRIGPYKLLQKIGEGGFGAVYMADQIEPVRRRVALKVIKLGMDTKQVIARFEAERQALAMMDHPNIAKVLDAGTTETGRPYFVMELVRGIKMTEYCDQNNLPTQQRLELFQQVCHAIQHAHQKGIIHRDVKPSNILVTLHDGVPVPKVIDFGVAKATQQPLTDKTLFTAYEQVIGTPAYMSPEQAEMSGMDIDTRSDIYSLGVLLYELLTGRLPFEAKELLQAGLDEMRRMIREQDPPKPSTRLSTLTMVDLTNVAKHRNAAPPKLINLIRGDLDWIVMKALEKDRTRRYETANGLAADLLRHLKNEPVVACPPSAAYRFQRLVRRNRLAFGAGVALAGALAAGTVISSWQALIARRARESERTQRVAAQREREHATAAQKVAESERMRADQQRETAQRYHYVASMNLAQQAWEQNHVGRLRELLDETATYAERRFEWYYWQRQTHLALKTFRGHSSRVRSVAFSPDGQRIATGSWDQTAKVWEAASGKELLTLRAHVSGINSVAFSPDGQRIVTENGDRTATVWEAASGRELLTLKIAGEFVGPVAFSPDGQRIVTGTRDATATVWETMSGRNLGTLGPHGAQLRSVAFSPGGERIVTGGQDGTATVWETVSGKEVLLLKAHFAPVLFVGFAAGGQRLITGSEETKVWDAVTGKELLTFAEGTPLGISSDGQLIVTGSDDATAKVRDAATGKELLSLKGHSDRIDAAAFSPDGRWVVTGSGDTTAKLWEVVRGAPPDATSFERIQLKCQGMIFSFPFFPEAQRVVPGIADQILHVYQEPSDPSDNASRVELRRHGRPPAMGCVVFSPDGRRIVTGHADNTVKVWDTASGRELFTYKGHTSGIVCAAFSPDGQWIATGGDYCTAEIREAATGKELRTIKVKAHSEGIVRRFVIESMAFSPDGQRIALGDRYANDTLWEVATGKELMTFKGGAPVAFAPDGQRILTGSEYVTANQTAKVWDSASGQELLTLKGHSKTVTAVAYSRDGQRIATGSDDGTVKVWDATSGRDLLTLRCPGRSIGSVGFSTDGRRMVASCAFGEIWDKIWEAASVEQVSNWRNEEVTAAHAAELEAAHAAFWALTGRPRSLAPEDLKTQTAFLDYYDLVRTGGKEAKAAELSQQILNLRSKNSLLLNVIAQMILTDEKLKGRRDLDLALKIAKSAYDACAGKSWFIVDTYARALFDTGKRAEAAKLQKQAVALCPNVDQRAALEATLKEYEAKLSKK